MRPAMRALPALLLSLFVIVAAHWLLSCSGGSDTEEETPAAATFKIGGSVLGLVGKLILQDNGKDDLEITADGQFVFATDHESGTAYKVTIHAKPSNQNCSVYYDEGTINQANVNDVVVLCLNKTWHHPKNLGDYFDPEKVGIFKPISLVTNSKGDAIIVWAGLAPVGRQLFMSQYQGGTWTHPKDMNDTPLSPDDTYADSQDVAMNDNGDIVVVWRQDDPAIWQPQIFKSEYRSGTWTHPSSIEDYLKPVANDAKCPKVAMDGEGNTVIAWVNSDGPFYRIFKKEYRDGTWQDAAPISPATSDASVVNLAMDDSGNALIVWLQRKDGLERLFMSEYRGGKWTHPENLDHPINPKESASENFQVHMDNLGNAMIVWSQHDGVSANPLYRSEYRGGTWTHPKNAQDHFSATGYDVNGFDVAIADNGHALIGWYHDTPGGHNGLSKSEYREGSWTDPKDINDRVLPDVFIEVSGIRAGMDEHDNAVLLYLQEDGVGVEQLFKSEYRNSVWKHPENLSDNMSSDLSSVGEPALDMNALGNAFVVWLQNGGGQAHIYKSEYR